MLFRSVDLDAGIIETSISKNSVSSALGVSRAPVYKEVTIGHSRGSKDVGSARAGHRDVTLTTEDGGVLKRSVAGLRGTRASIDQNIFLSGQEVINNVHRGEDTIRGDGNRRSNQCQDKQSSDHEKGRESEVLEGRKPVKTFRGHSDWRTLEDTDTPTIGRLHRVKHNDL